MVGCEWRGGVTSLTLTNGTSLLMSLVYDTTKLYLAAGCAASTANAAVGSPMGGPGCGVGRPIEALGGRPGSPCGGRGREGSVRGVYERPVPSPCCV